MKKHLNLALVLGVVAIVAPSLRAQTFGPTGATSLSVAVAAEAAISVTTATTNLTAGATAFTNYTGSTSFSYKVRTSSGSGSGSITLEITTDFAPTGGPSVGSPLTGDTISYTCSTSGVGTACTGSQTPSTTAQTNVLSFTKNIHSSKAGDSGSVSWTIPDDPAYPTGTYTATATFTISAT
ncbi:MAG TPA: hypothetical protein VMU19_14955 [Bryobacteraceae bacterium]|nr:hypothetical protein [Bryobacteraceae bacterium]